MPDFAKLDENNVVVNILGAVSEPDDGGTYVEFFYDRTNNPRKNPAAIGGSYLPEHDAFVHKKPYASWTLDMISFQWEPPVPMPPLFNVYWDEATLSWVVL